MTNPSVTGTITQIKTSASSGSQAVTIPADTDLVLAMGAYWEASSAHTATINSVSMTNEIENSDGGNQNAVILYLANPATGSQTFAWDNAQGAYDEGCIWFIVCLKDVDTDGDPITDSDEASGSTTPTTPSITTTTDDTLYCVVCSYDGAADAGYGSGQTEIADSGGAYNSDHAAVGSKAGVSTSTTMQAEGADANTIIMAVSVKGSSGGPSTVDIPVAMRAYRNLRI